MGAPDAGCLTENTVMLFVEGSLGATELSAATAHIDRCSTCFFLVTEMAGCNDHLRRPEAPPTWAPPSSFEEYRLVRPLGSGSMGQVFLAHDTVLDRLVAVKFIRAGAPGAKARERFLGEARAIARLLHPNVVTIFRVGQVDDKPYLVSEFVRGQSLDALPAPVPWERLLRIAVGLARGLCAAHRRGVLHRDIKPANAIIAGDGEVKLLDFGLAKILDEADATPAPPSPEGERGGAPSLTATGALLGTPRYMAPEAWRGEPATVSTDIYSLGVLLYELASGHPPHTEPALGELRAAVLHRDAKPLSKAVPGIDPAFATLVDRCLLRDPAARLASSAELCQALEQIATPALRAKIPTGNPYRGLHPFEVEHRALFFGRGAEARAVVELLRAEPLVVVAGDSGVGKSSLCRAGVLALCQDGALGEGRTWSTARLLPGRHPLTALADALSPLLAQAPDALLDAARATPSAIGRALRARLGSNGGLVLFLDQAEELVTQGEATEAAILGEIVVHMGQRIPGVRVLLAARSDHLTRLAAVPGLADLLGRALYLLRPLQPAELREAVVGPARETQIRFESEALVDALCASNADAEGGLPLLQFALAELWEARDSERGVITASALDSIGGVSGALARHADGVLLALQPDQRTAAREILLRLVSGRGTRLSRPASELIHGAAAERAALEALVRARLLVAREAGPASSEGAVYEVAHEALINGWSTLRAWLDTAAEMRAARARIEAAATEWRRLGESAEALWSERQMADAQQAGLSAGDLQPREAAFLAASRRNARGRRLRRWGAAIGAPLLLLGVYGGFALRLQQRTDREIKARVNESERALEQARRKANEVERLRDRAFARFEAGDAEAGERAWSELKQPMAEARAAYQGASTALEQAVLLDSHRAPVRRRLAEVLYEQALLAEHDPNAEHKEGLIQRMATYDAEGELRRRLTAEARLTVDTRPKGAAVRVQRYEERGGARRPGAPLATGMTPGFERALEPGSYLVTLTAPGRATVRFPVSLRREERHAVTLDLPVATAIPNGFVYIPPGRFLIGSADEGLRDKISAEPLHESRTGAYLIGRTEVTMGQWIEYLHDLPEPERTQRRPQAGPTPAALALTEETPGHPVLHFRRAGQEYVAQSGAPLRYLGRDRRAEQDWLSLPVVGISFEDGQAYAAWLRRGGRVPGARLCDGREWERAARGADDRLYPHGDRLSPEDANYDETYGRNQLAFGPDEAGSHPDSDSPFGVADMSGNAWEWTTSTDAAHPIVYRGGSWYNDKISALIANRNYGEPTLRHVEIGLRICASAPPAE